MTLLPQIHSARRPVVLLSSVVALGALVTGCADPAGQAAAGAPSSSAAPSASPSASASSSSSGVRASALSKGLLPASAFGAQATVVSLTLQQLQQTAGGQLGAADGVQVQPPQCATALTSTRPDTTNLADAVAQSATTQTAGAQGGVVTVEAILQGKGAPSGGAADRLRSTVTTCPRITVTAPQLGTATVEFTPVDVSGTGPQAAAASYTTTVTPPNGAPVSVPALVGVAQDGDRQVLLLTVVAGNPAAGAAAPAPDAAAFVALLQKAYRTQHDALG